MHREETRLRAKAAPPKAALQPAMASDYQGALNAGTGRNCSFNEVIGMINAQLGTDIK